MARVRDTDYLYISARIKAIEKHMLTREKLSRIASARTDEEALKLLSEVGINATDTKGELETAIAQRREQMLDLLYKYCPDKRVIDLFRLKYDYHNIKAIIKAQAQDIDTEGLLSDSAIISGARMEIILREGSSPDISPIMLNAAKEAEDLLARTKDPQLSDILLDRAMTRQMSEIAIALRSDFIKGYVSLYIDCMNIRVATRAARTGKGSEFLRRALSDGGTVRAERMYQGATPELLKGLFGLSSHEAVVNAAVTALDGGDMAAMDMACDNAMTTYLRRARLIPFGEAQVICYLLATEGELVALRTVFAGRAAGLSADNIIERLRDSYV